MGPKKGRRNVRKIEVPTDTPAEFEFGETAADIQRRREEREQREREEAEKQQTGRGRGMKPGGQKLHNHTKRREWPKRIESSDSEMENDSFR